MASNGVAHVIESVLLPAGPVVTSSDSTSRLLSSSLMPSTTVVVSYPSTTAVVGNPSTTAVVGNLGSSRTDSPDGVSAGAIAGIVVGVVVALAAAAFVMHKKQSTDETRPQVSFDNPLYSTAEDVDVESGNNAGEYVDAGSGTSEYLEVATP